MTAIKGDETEIFCDEGKPDGEAPDVEAAEQSAGHLTDTDGVMMISASPLFDRDWYRLRYLAGLPEADPALHFLTCGVSAHADPGPGFSSSWYILAHDDVDITGINPLVHYELHGRADARPIHASDDVDRTPSLHHVRLVRNSGVFAPEWYVDRYPDADFRNPIRHYLEAGSAAGYDPSPDFSTSEYLAANPDVAATGLNALIHYLLHGRYEDRPVRPMEHALADGVLETGEVGGESDGIPLLRFGSTEIALAEPVDADRLVAFEALASAQRGLPTVETVFTAADGKVLQPSKSGVRFADIGTHLEQWLRIDDAWYGDATTLRLRMTSTGSGVLAGWQRDGAALTAIGSWEVGEGMVVASFRLIDPLAAVVFGVMTPDGDLVSASFVAFPSRLRGGRHAAERLLGEQVPPSISDQAAPGECDIGTVIIERDNSDVSLAMARWIADTFGASVTDHADGPAIATPKRPNSGAYALHVPGNGFPTIGALSTGIDPSVGAGVATRWLSVEPDGRATLVSVPGDKASSPACPGLRHIENGSVGCSLAPLILRSPALGSRHPIATADVERAERAGRITILIDFIAGGDAVPLLASLSAQKLPADSELILLGCTDDALVRQAARAFPALRSLDGGRRSAFAQLAWEGAAVIVALDAAIRIDDPNLLATLASIAVQDGVATAGCTIVGTDGEGGAHVVTRVSVGSPPALVLREVALGQHVPGATLPVVAVSPDLCAFSGAALRALDDGAMAGARPDLSFALHALDAGYANIFSDSVVAAIAKPLEYWDIVDPLSRPLPVERWGTVLAGTVQMQAL